MYQSTKATSELAKWNKEKIEDLLEILRGLESRGIEVDTTSLPTAHNPAIENFGAEGIYSWDQQGQCLIERGFGWEIVTFDRAKELLG